MDKIKLIWKNEKWKRLFVDGVEWNYYISNMGNVKNATTNTVLRPGTDKKGYKQVMLSHKGKFRTFKVHRLVALSFIENTHNKPQVNHINGKKYYNHDYNLEWMTNSENQIHALRMGLKDLSKIRGSNCNFAKIDEDVAIQICRYLESGIPTKRICKSLNITIDVVKDIKRRKTWKWLSKDYDF